jgi:hypothetical protein
MLVFVVGFDRQKLDFNSVFRLFCVDDILVRLVRVKYAVLQIICFFIQGVVVVFLALEDDDALVLLSENVENNLLLLGQ